jgi:PAS domain S-box-containing protein/putative nucleotidyltransferase with HDIG domain
MEWNKVLFLIPYLLALAIITSIFFYAWRHRHIRGGSAYTWYVAGQVLWATGYILELLAPSLSGKIFWDSFQWIAGFFIVIAFPVFAVEYTGYRLKRPKLVWGLVSIVPVAMTLLVLTDSQHHLIYPNPHLFYDAAFPELEYDFTWVVYGYAIYSYLVTFTGLGLLVNRMIHPHRLYRRQIFTVALGFFIPIFFTIMTVAGVKFTPYRDVSILTFALGNLIVAWGLFRYNLFEVVPIARDLVIENMEDLVVVLDMQDRIVDINPVALDALNLDSTQVIGQPAEIIFNPWPELVEKFFRPENIRLEISLSTSEEVNRYEIKSTLLHDKNNRYIGRVFVARDVTERAALQRKLEKLNENLEERVRERTEELRESVDRYRAVVENQTEFIVRWKPDRTRTFVNEAYCRYFGLTLEQAMQTDFLLLIAEEDRRAVQEKISRLMAGLSDSEAEIHRAIKPDGSIVWQEWVDTAIRNESGKVIEFQSVGRDVTERKQAEENLAIAYDTTLEGWARALEMRDQETKDHSERVVNLTMVLARTMGITGDDLLQIRRGAILHDIGKMAIPDEILRKRGPLTIGERKIVEQHPTRGYELLSRIPFLEKALVIPYCHHEHWDGSGYPRGLKGEQIPLAARIFSVIDVWDAVQSERPYNHSWSIEKAIQYLKEQAGKHFDPQCVSVFLGLVEQGKI